MIAQIADICAVMFVIVCMALFVGYQADALPSWLENWLYEHPTLCRRVFNVGTVALVALIFVRPLFDDGGESNADVWDMARG